MTSPMLTPAAIEAARWELHDQSSDGVSAATAKDALLEFLAAQDRVALARVVCDAMEQNAPDLGRQMPLARVAADALLGDVKA